MPPAEFDHATPNSTGVLLINLGTPADCTPAAIRRYLREFLSDKRVIEAPRWLWWPILNCIILPTRPRKTAGNYAKIWRDDGSPLLTISRRIRKKLQRAFADDDDANAPPVRIELGMRYGTPSVADALDKLHTAGARRVLLLPLYPQYCAATTASAFDAAADALRARRWIPELRTLNHYHDRPEYIAALAKSIRDYRHEHGASDMLLMSFHGIPRDYFLAGDPYHCECQKTARLLAEELGLAADEWRVSFQSRFGPREWLRPYTDETLRQMAAAGMRNVQVICPGFAADCLETLEEIAMQNREVFVAAGGESFGYIPCLNDADSHIQMLVGIIRDNIAGWATCEDAEAGAMRKQRATAMGAEY